MLEIVFKDGEFKTWKPEEYDTYEYRKEIFVVLKCNQWVGIYNMDTIKSIEYVKDK